MKWWCTLIVVVFLCCKSKTALPEVKPADTLSERQADTMRETFDSLAAIDTTAGSTVLPPPPPVKNPSGLYRFILKDEQGRSIEHIIAFNGRNFRLQQHFYPADSVVITEGSWAYSDDVIWTYRNDQVVAGRYRWQGNRLQYYLPGKKAHVPLEPLQPISQNTKLMKKGREGIWFLGLGTEPFWNVSLDKNDSISFQLAEWPAPLKLKLKESWQVNDSTLYFAQNDSISLRLAILPYFCSDGMSDFTYNHQIRVNYGGQSFSGCAVVYKNR